MASVLVAPAEPHVFVHSQKAKNQKPRVIDIKQCNEAFDLKADIIQGLTAKQKRLSSIALWDARGLAIFENITQHKDYYLRTREIDALKTHLDRIVDIVDTNSVLVELGCGSSRKTGILLEALERREKKVEYFALDMDAQFLDMTMSELGAKAVFWKHVSCTGLLGTYEDAASWIRSQRKTLKDRPVTFLWLGNSIANLKPKDASAILGQLADACAHGGHPPPSFIIGVDGNANRAEIERSYDLPGGLSRMFLQNGLLNVNSMLGKPLFNPFQWSFHGEWDEKLRLHESYHEAIEDTNLELEGRSIPVQKGERVHAVSSGKWRQEELAPLFQDARLELVDRFSDSTTSTYGIYYAARL